VQTQEEWERVNRFALKRTGIEIKWEQSEEDAKAVKEEVKKLISDGITMNEAVKIALLNNRKLQAAFEEIGIAKADLVQAGLFTNPNLSAIFRFPFRGSGTGIEAAGVLNIADLWQIPIRKKSCYYKA
jgi:outer membrane protein TolC